MSDLATLLIANLAQPYPLKVAEQNLFERESICAAVPVDGGKTINFSPAFFTGAAAWYLTVIPARSPAMVAGGHGPFATF
jgi:hypothetical protein